MGPEWTRRFVSSRSIRVSFLPFSDWRPLLERTVPGFNLRYGPGVLDALLELTHGHPYLTQAMAQQLVKDLNATQPRRHEARLPDIDAAAERVMIRHEGFLRNVWSDAQDDGQALLRGVMDGRQASLGSARSRLREMDVLDDQGRIAVPLFERFFRQIQHE